MKWLVYSSAKRIWFEDKQLWRYLTPHLSGGMAFGFILLIKSNVINIFDEASLDKPSAVAGIGFFVGYFSDKAAGKMAEVARSLFGATARTEFQKVAPQNGNAGEDGGQGGGDSPQKPSGGVAGGGG